MGTGDVFQLPYDDVCELCRRYSRGKFKTGKNILSSQFLKSTAWIGVTRAEIGDSFKIFESDIISSLNSQMDILQVGKNEEFGEMVFPRCQNKHITKDFSLDSLRICSIYGLNHSMGSFSLQQFHLMKWHHNCHGNCGIHVWFISPSLHSPTLIINQWILWHHGKCCSLSLTPTKFVHKSFMVHLVIIWILFLALQHYLFLFTIHNIFNHILFTR